jgi:hypothetical protein
MVCLMTLGTGELTITAVLELFLIQYQQMFREYLLLHPGLGVEADLGKELMLMRELVAGEVPDHYLKSCLMLSLVLPTRSLLVQGALEEVLLLEPE